MWGLALEGLLGLRAECRVVQGLGCRFRALGVRMADLDRGLLKALHSGIPDGKAVPESLLKSTMNYKP